MEWDPAAALAGNRKLHSTFFSQGRAERALPFLSFPGFFACVIFLERIHRERQSESFPRGENALKEEEIIARLKSAAKDGKIPCAVAFKVATECNVSTQEIGNLLNQLKIKIANCQLGCF
jgi:hypothetical protein